MTFNPSWLPDRHDQDEVNSEFLRVVGSGFSAQEAHALETFTTEFITSAKRVGAWGGLDSLPPSSEGQETQEFYESLDEYENRRARRRANREIRRGSFLGDLPRVCEGCGVRFAAPNSPHCLGCSGAESA